MFGEEHKLSISKVDTVEKKRRILRKAVITILALIVLAGILYTGFLIYNNVSFYNDASFAKQIDKAITQAENWVDEHRIHILTKKNTALLTMLRECNDVKSQPIFEDIVKTFLNLPHYGGRCWKREIDPNWPTNEYEVNKIFEEETVIDYKWLMYAIAPDQVRTTPEKIHLFEPDRWQRRQLTHQLFALTALRNRKGANEELDKLIEHLCSRLSLELVFDVAVVDIYIQKVAFVLNAGFPKKIRRRWVERIIDNQLPDGGWNDRWFFLQSGRRPILGLEQPAGNQHATVQAVLVLYMIRYQYPEHFGLE